MKNYQLKFTTNGKYVTADGSRCDIIERVNNSYLHSKGFNHLVHVCTASDEDGAAIALSLHEYVPAPKPPHAITKRELVDKLIALGVAAEFNALLGQLPLEEKLRWEASPTIHPDYPFLVQGRPMIFAALKITGEQFDNIFR